MKNTAINIIGLIANIWAIHALYVMFIAPIY